MLQGICATFLCEWPDDVVRMHFKGNVHALARYLYCVWKQYRGSILWVR
jgi:hypothetical protein